MTIFIRSESGADIKAIHDSTEKALRDVPYADHTEHMIVSALRDSGSLALSLVAEILHDIVDHVALSPVTLSDGTSGGMACLELGP